MLAYRVWVGKFQGFVRSRPMGELGTEEVRVFLTELAVRHGVAASTQNQAFNALLDLLANRAKRDIKGGQESAGSRFVNRSVLESPHVPSGRKRRFASQLTTPRPARRSPKANPHFSDPIFLLVAYP